MTSDKAFQAITFITSRKKLIKLNYIFSWRTFGWVEEKFVLCCVVVTFFQFKVVCANVIMFQCRTFPLKAIFSRGEGRLLRDCDVHRFNSTPASLLDLQRTSIFRSLASLPTEFNLRNQSFISKLSGEKRNWIANAIKLMLHHSTAWHAMFDVRIEREWKACRRQRCVLLIFPSHLTHNWTSKTMEVHKTLTFCRHFGLQATEVNEKIFRTELRPERPTWILFKLFRTRTQPIWLLMEI